jgi:D-hexose-6-phosphate mutarotase
MGMRMQIAIHDNRREGIADSWFEGAGEVIIGGFIALVFCWTWLGLLAGAVLALHGLARIRLW